MSKQVSAKELSEIVTKLLTDPAGAGELSGYETFQQFMTEIAQAVCDHCGGEIHHPAESLDDIWYIGIHGNSSLPSAFGGIWREADKEGDLSPEGSPEWFEAKYGDEHPEWTKAEWQHDVREGNTRLGYWPWVAHNVETAEDDDGSDDVRPVVLVDTSGRDLSIFVEALSANFIVVNDPEAKEGRLDLSVRRDLLAQQVLADYPAEIVITQELYDEDGPLGECLNWMNRQFEFPNWEGRTIGEFQSLFKTPREPGCMNFLQYPTRQPGKGGLSLKNVTLQEMREASRSANGWRLPSGFELQFQVH